ncbi:hypothetical protein TNCT_43031 [Trichonephila clavata]|uniref:Uncharacterized protein n=1 Tax=Trichonephila clavata TaxID=2740835 RepID=A0A8X6GMH7_TRICU|nr:hypothetical protein TNCT_43031 [Trichonephila clavata]
MTRRWSVTSFTVEPARTQVGKLGSETHFRLFRHYSSSDKSEAESVLYQLISPQREGDFRHDKRTHDIREVLPQPDFLLKVMGKRYLFTQKTFSDSPSKLETKRIPASKLFRHASRIATN